MITDQQETYRQMEKDIEDLIMLCNKGYFGWQHSEYARFQNIVDRYEYDDKIPPKTCLVDYVRGLEQKVKELESSKETA